MASLSVARTAGFAMQFVVFALLADHLGVEGLGIFTFGVAFAQLFEVLAGFGFNQVVTRQLAQEPEHEHWLVPNYLYSRLVLAVAGYLLLLGALLLLDYDPAEREAALIAGLMLFVTALSAFSPPLEVRLRMGWLATADVIEAGLLLVVTVVLVWRDQGVATFLWAYVLVNLFREVLVWWRSRTLLALSWRPRPRAWLDVAKMALPLGIASVLGVVYYQADVALLALLGDQADVGEYGAAFRVVSALLIVTGVVMAVLSPVLARSFVEGPAILQRRFATSIHLMGLLALPLLVGGAMVGWRVLPALPGFSAYGRGGVALSILAPAAALILFATVVQGVLIAGHRQARLLGIAAAGAAANVVLNVALIPSFGLYASAGATLATEAAVLALSTWAARRLGVRWPSAGLVRAGRATLVLALVLSLTYWLPALVQVAIAVVAYGLALLPTGSLRWSDLGGLMGGDGDDVVDLVLDGEPPAAAPEGAEVLHERSLRAVRARLGGIRGVRFHTDRPVPLAVLLGARLAACLDVEVIGAGSQGGGLVARASRRYLADPPRPSLTPP
jgi:O-antigen/teichoic acid export membrane protein